MPEAELYIDLLKRSVADALQERTWYVPIPRPKSLIKRVLSNLLAARGITLVREVDPSVRGEGSERPPRGTAWLDATSAFTLLGQDRLDNLQWCVEDVLRRKVPGDMIETGVWRGGACILMRAILKAYGVRDRKVWAADSFEGLPPADPAQYPLDRHSTFHEQRGFAVSLEEVRHNFDKYGLLDDQVEFVKGWFCDTLPKLAGHTWAVIHLDGDMYESTAEGLENLYPGLSPGGYVIVDDFGAVPACRQAVLDFRKKYHIRDEMRVADWTGVYWQRDSTDVSVLMNRAS
ncbi:MAG TPA: TylF/MycF/NovP-related O-methyltransferase [Verrucomicrobiae bacterium]|nr:TylF/MycF/NovP-related O-methyltransferase [Verrucomicrobiae bacterium]